MAIGNNGARTILIRVIRDQDATISHQCTWYKQAALSFRICVTCLSSAHQYRLLCHLELHTYPGFVRSVEEREPWPAENWKHLATCSVHWDIRVWHLAETGQSSSSSSFQQRSTHQWVLDCCKWPVLLWSICPTDRHWRLDWSRLERDLDDAFSNYSCEWSQDVGLHSLRENRWSETQDFSFWHRERRVTYFSERKEIE